MILKDTLVYPYSNTDKMDFIVRNNHQLGYEIRYNGNNIEAWGKDNNELLEQTKASIRTTRNSYLSDTDIYMIEDYPITVGEKELVKEYRQYLRDYTKQEEWYNTDPKSYDEYKEEYVIVEN